MSSQYLAKIIEQLKLYRSRDIGVADMLYLLNDLVYGKGFPLVYVQKFIQDNQAHSEIEWRNMNDQAIQQMHSQQLQYIRRHQKEWRSEQQKQMQYATDYKEQKKNIQKILKEKLLTKEQLINTYLQQIKRNSAILAKSVPSKNTKQPTQSKPTQSIAQKYIYQQNIRLLQKRINIMTNNLKFNTHNDLQFIDNQHYHQLSQQQNILNQVLQDFHFKRQHYSNLFKNPQFQEISQKTKKITSQSKSLNRKLKQLFLRYSSQNYDPSLSFQKNNKKLVHIDLRLFLKFFKELKQAFSGQFFITDQKNNKKFKTNNLTVLFKKYANNQRQINFIQFLSINYDLFLCKENAFQNIPESQILGEQKQYKVELSSKSLQQINEQLLKYKKVKGIFFNQKVNNIINIHSKPQTFDDVPSLKRRGSQEIINTDQKLEYKGKARQQKLSKMIDKTLEDYQATRKKIHETFIRRHTKQTLQSLRQRLVVPYKGSKFLLDKRGNKSQDMKNKNKKDEQDYLQNPKANVKAKAKGKAKSVYSKKNIFDQIIDEVEQQDEQEESFSMNINRKSKSLANILPKRQRVSVGDPKSRTSPVSKRKGLFSTSLKNIFTLPKITRMSQQRFENQSITKTLGYLYQTLGKQQEAKIKKILELDNLQSLKVHAISNQYLKEYFSKQINLQSQKEKEITLKKQQAIKRSCKKFKEQNYQRFMRFS